MKISYRVGIIPGPWPDDGDLQGFLWRLIDLCEESEIDSIWFSERLSSPIPVLEPMPSIFAVAARTTRLNFGPSLFITPFRIFARVQPVLAQAFKAENRRECMVRAPVSRELLRPIRGDC